MRIIGITGGIGSGKSHICQFLRDLKYPVYSSDKAAKEIVNTHEDAKKEIIQLLGKKAYLNGKYNVPYVSESIFKSKKLLSDLNAIIHPRVNENFHIFVSGEKLKGSKVIFKESALIVETGDYKNLDHVFLVTSPPGVRKLRVLSRSGMNNDKYQRILETQWTDSEKKNFVNAIVANDENKPFLADFLSQLHKILLLTH